MDVEAYAAAKNYANTVSAGKVNYTDKLSSITGSMTDAEKGTVWSRQSIVKTSVDAVLVPLAQYYLGLQTTLTLTLPTTGMTAGQTIEVVFYSNTTATTLNIIGDFLGNSPTIQANSKTELNFLYDGTAWSLLSNITALTTQTITATVTNATAAASNPTKMNELFDATLTYTFNGTSYTCPDSVTVTGATGVWTKDSDTQGTLVLSEPTGAVTFTVAGVAV